MRGARLSSVAVAMTVLSLAACGRAGDSGGVSTSTPTPRSSLSAQQQLALVKDGIRTMLSEMAPAKLGDLCTAWEKDPKVVLETFVRPLTATGANPELAGVAFVQEITVACR